MNPNVSTTPLLPPAIRRARRGAGLLAVFLVVAILGSPACDVFDSGGGSEGDGDSELQFSFEGRIEDPSHAFGCWSIWADHRQRYLPFTLPQSFRVHGLRVSVVARPMIDAVSTCSSGQIIELVDIDRID